MPIGKLVFFSIIKISCSTHSIHFHYLPRPPLEPELLLESLRDLLPEELLLE